MILDPAIMPYMYKQVTGDDPPVERMNYETAVLYEVAKAEQKLADIIDDMGRELAEKK